MLIDELEVDSPTMFANSENTFPDTDFCDCLMVNRSFL